jgi:hypothetical protein
VQRAAAVAMVGPPCSDAIAAAAQAGRQQVPELQASSHGRRWRGKRVHDSSPQIKSQREILQHNQNLVDPILQESVRIFLVDPILQESFGIFLVGPILEESFGILLIVDPILGESFRIFVCLCLFFFFFLVDPILEESFRILLIRFLKNPSESC